jgi:surface protein
MTVKLSNNVRTTLAAALSATATTLVVKDGTVFPALGTGEYYYLTLQRRDGASEIVRVTAAIGPALTAVRGVDGTSPMTFFIDDLVELRVTAASVSDAARDAAAQAIDALATGGSLWWARPADWLKIMPVGALEQKFVGLMAVFPQSNFAALSAAGDYTVDWGDGTTTNYASGAVASHIYDYSLISNSTFSSRGYKQVIVTVTPQAGQNLTALDITVRHPQADLQTYEPGWLDIEVGSPNFSTKGLVFSRGSIEIIPFMVERIRIANLGGQTDCASLFSGLQGLQYVPLFNTAAVTNMQGMFFNCTSLRDVPLFNTAAVTNMDSMFFSCLSLQSVPLFNTAAVTNMAYMFYFCISLQAVPLFDTAAVVDMSATFGYCERLLTIPLINTAAVTSMTATFGGCRSLSSVPALVTTSVSSEFGFVTTFSDCRSLSRIEAKEFRFSFSVAGCKLGPAQLNELYTNLPAVTGRTITVEDNYGVAGHDPTIATAKGWTVVA